jgi:hypothetical protein
MPSSGDLLRLAPQLKLTREYIEEIESSLPLKDAIHSIVSRIKARGNAWHNKINHTIRNQSIEHYDILTEIDKVILYYTYSVLPN